MITGMHLWFSWATSATWSTLSRVNDRSPRTRSRKQWKNGQTANTPRSRVNGRLKVRFIQLLRELFCLFFFLLNFLLELHKTPSKTEAVEKPLKKWTQLFANSSPITSSISIICHMKRHSPSSYSVSLALPINKFTSTPRAELSLILICWLAK